jgi:hypothetical protein
MTFRQVFCRAGLANYESVLIFPDYRPKRNCRFLDSCPTKSANFVGQTGFFGCSRTKLKTAIATADEKKRPKKAKIDPKGQENAKKEKFSDFSRKSG